MLFKEIVKEAMDMEFIKYKMAVAQILGERPSPEIVELIQAGYEDGLPEEETAQQIQMGGADLAGRTEAPRRPGADMETNTNPDEEMNFDTRPDSERY